jgi:hypothetical protein
MAIDTRRCFWFGTEERADFFPTPLQGADASPAAWGTDATLLNGGGTADHSWGSHKRYSFEWPESSSPEVAQKMKSYRDGTYGRGLLYFIDPLSFRGNILPASLASPGMAVGDEAPSLVYDLEPQGVSVSGGELLDLPVTAAYYNLSSTPVQAQATLDSSTFIPIPTGMTLHVGAFYSFTGTGGIFATPVNLNGTLGTPVKLTALANSSSSVVANTFTGVKGVRIWMGRSSAVTSSVTAVAMIARLVETGKPAPSQGPWIGGQGHSGCRFSGVPTYVINSPIEGGRIGFAASFIEVGSWVYG